MKAGRHFLALVAAAALIGVGSGEAIACGDDCKPNVASQASSNSQVLPISLGLGAALPVNVNAPIGILSGGPVQGTVTQNGVASTSGGSADSNDTKQSISQNGKGANWGSQSASNSQILPIAAALGAAIPINLNVPVSVLSNGPAQGDVTQTGDADVSDVEASNNGLKQGIEQEGKHGGNFGSQSSSNSQILPIAAALGAAIPINLNVPVSVLSNGPVQGDVDQTGEADVSGVEASNNDLKQKLEQKAKDGEKGNEAIQSSSSSQLLPIALGASLAVPVNANIPISVLSEGLVQGDVTQDGDATAETSGAANLKQNQKVEQKGGDGKGSSAVQSASSSQLLPIALGASLALPVNANIPVAVLSSGPTQGDVTQTGDATAESGSSANNATKQGIKQDGEGGKAVQSSSSSQLLEIALGPALGVPVNLNVPVSVLSFGPSQGDISQTGTADATSSGSSSSDLAQAVCQGGCKNEDDDKGTFSLTEEGSSNGGTSAAQTIDGVKSVTDGVEMPMNVNGPVAGLGGSLPLGLGVVHALVSSVRMVLLNPLGAVTGVAGSVLGGL